MSWPITYYDEEPSERHIGAMWPEPGYTKSNIISQRYLHEVAEHRPPLVVVLPGKELFLLDRVACGDPARRGWDVKIEGKLVNGQQPKITVSPSIDCEGRYHGYIRDGVILDDCERRTFAKS